MINVAGGSAGRNQVGYEEWSFKPQLPTAHSSCYQLNLIFELATECAKCYDILSVLTRRSYARRFCVFALGCSFSQLYSAAAKAVSPGFCIPPFSLV